MVDKLSLPTTTVSYTVQRFVNNDSNKKNRSISKETNQFANTERLHNKQINIQYNHRISGQ